MTVQRPAEPSFTQQFVRPQQLLEGKVNVQTHLKPRVRFCPEGTV